MLNVETQPVKLKDSKKILKRLWSYLYRHKWMVVLALLLSLTSNLLALIGPLLSGHAIDAIGTGAGMVNFQDVFFYCSLMVVFYIISSVLSYLLSVWMIQLSQKVIFQMRSDLFNKLADLPVGYFDSHQTGEIISRIL